MFLPGKAGRILNPKKYRKKFQELEFKDAFMFAAMMQDSELCRSILERILGVSMKEVVVRPEYAIWNNPDYRGVRLDAYADDQNGTIFDVEMQVSREKHIPKRSRMYQGQMDVSFLQPGMDVGDLPKSIVIFICCFDPCDRGRYRYTFREQCEEDGELLGDGTCKVFLNTKGTNPEEVPKELVQFLSYIDCPKNYVLENEDALIQRMQIKIADLKQNRNLEARYMQFQEMMKQERAEGRTEGHENVLQLIMAMERDGHGDDIFRLSEDGGFFEEMLAYYHII